MLAPVAFSLDLGSSCHTYATTPLLLIAMAMLTLLLYLGTL